MKGFFEEKYFCRIVFAFLLLCQIIYTTYVFSDRQIFHSDEIWSYGLANSYYKPFIYGEDGIFIERITPEEYTHENEWVSAKIFNDYLTVQEGERFSYDSVYHNQSLDHHPPLYYALLHTVCSLFPNQFSLWYGYFLNVIFLVITQIFLYKLTEKISGSRLKALLTCILYGAGNGAVLTFTFIRQYSLLTMLCVMYTYFAACLYLDNKSGKLQKKNIFSVIIIAFCAFMTHYYSIIYIGAFTACFCLWLLLNGKWKRMLQFGLSMIGTLGIYFLLYPACLSQTFEGNARKVIGLPFMVQYRYFLNEIFLNNFGFSINIWGNIFLRLAWPCILLGLVCLLLLYIPFRKEIWVHNILSALRQLPKMFLMWLKGINYFGFFVLAGILIQCVAVNLTVCVLKMKIYSMRYVFMNFPLACFVAVLFAHWILKVILQKKLPKLVTPILALIILIAVINVNLQNYPMFDRTKTGKPQEMAEIFRDKNCVFIVSDPLDYWLTTNASMYLQYADHVYLTWGEYFEDKKYSISGEFKTHYVIISSNHLEVSEQEQKMLEEIIHDDVSSNKKEQAELLYQKEEPDEIKLNEMIKSLNGGCNYKMVGILKLNGVIMYVLEIQESHS